MPKQKSYKKFGYLDEDSLCTQCLPISPGVELKDIPTTGEEYLLSVINERRNCAAVVKCKQDYSNLAKNQSRFVEEVPSISAAPDKLKPTVEWQNIQVADFSDVRMYISQIRSKHQVKVVRGLGFNEHSAADWMKFMNNNDSTLSNVIGIHQCLLDRGLVAFGKIIENIEPGQTIDNRTGQWIYAFLACTREPLHSDTTSALRTIARNCAEIRAKLNADDENAIAAVAPLNIFICLVARYFRQHDLADR